MKVILLDGTEREYSVAQNYCGVGFKSVTLDYKDFELLSTAPDLRAEIEKIASRMVPSQDE